MPTLVYVLPCDLADWRRLLEDGDPDAFLSITPPLLDLEDARRPAVERLRAGQVYGRSNQVDLDERSGCLHSYCEGQPGTAARRRLSGGGFIEIPLAHLEELGRARCVRERPARFASVSGWLGEPRCPEWLAGEIRADEAPRIGWGFLTSEEIDVVVATANVVASSALWVGARRRARRIADALDSRPLGTDAVTFVN